MSNFKNSRYSNAANTPADSSIGIKKTNVLDYFDRKDGVVEGKPNMETARSTSQAFNDVSPQYAPSFPATTRAANSYPTRNQSYYAQSGGIENEHNLRFWLVTLACTAIVQLVLGKWVLPAAYSGVIYSTLLTKLLIWGGVIIGFAGCFYYNTAISRYFNPFRRTVADYVFSPIISLVATALFAVLVALLKPIISMLLGVVIIMALIGCLFRRKR